MNRKIAKAYVEKRDGKDGVLEVAIASTSREDRHGESIDQTTWDLKNFKRNKVLLWGHNFREERPPIGKVGKIWMEGTGKRQKLMFQPTFDLEDPFAAMIYRKFQEGFLNSFSVGYIPGEIDGTTHKDCELLEISAVSVPANADANVRRSIEDDLGPIATWKSIMDYSKEEQIEEKKKVLPFSGFPPADESRAWNIGTAQARLRIWAGGPDVEKIDWTKYRKAYTWYNQDEESNFNSYLLAHHDVVENDLVTVWTGVRTAMGTLMGARGGAEIPENDRKAAYNHLLKHYEQFDKVAPEFKHVEEQTLKLLEGEIKASNYDQIINDIKGQIKLLRKDIKESEKKAERKAKENKEQDIKIALQLVNDSIKKSLVKGK